MSEAAESSKLTPKNGKAERKRENLEEVPIYDYIVPKLPPSLEKRMEEIYTAIAKHSEAKADGKDMLAKSYAANLTLMYQDLNTDDADEEDWWLPNEVKKERATRPENRVDVLTNPFGFRRPRNAVDGGVAKIE
ncbi:hypothetical protein DRE_00043 [Drechslerella stenobrocha 248]|uniref:Uncharacterized protein n=1 Tax=Drechslerella stenobrocha 248 TaxID=1043628 RepID=W7I8V0_9PEZI|nr:hypothetical protein DRE_00043 [Drechslerella stenobrocha 248]